MDYKIHNLFLHIGGYILLYCRCLDDNKTCHDNNLQIIYVINIIIFIIIRIIQLRLLMIIDNIYDYRKHFKCDIFYYYSCMAAAVFFCNKMRISFFQFAPAKTAV